jgi:23S rRNA (cytidine1920-2'-O)/16S rRNA (cytidine1409-2'-O)-methyltransferase
MTEKKQRLDQLMVERGLAQSRTRAQALIMAGQVVVGDHRVDKPGIRVSPRAEVRLKGPDHPYVSRGGVKLEGALDEFDLDVTGMTALDVGASTGGFCDCLLQHGARRVYALDVGRGQLHNRLRQDERVVSMEGVNIRNLGKDALPEKTDLAVLDLSFISLRMALPPVLPHLKEGARIIALVKPQFEVGKGKVGKGGIVRDEKLREEAVDAIAGFAESLGIEVQGRSRSCIEGTDGNVEYFLLMGIRSPRRSRRDPVSPARPA